MSYDFYRVIMCDKLSHLASLFLSLYNSKPSLKRLDEAHDEHDVQSIRKWTRKISLISFSNIIKLNFFSLPACRTREMRRTLVLCMKNNFYDSILVFYCLLMYVANFSLLFDNVSASSRLVFNKTERAREVKAQKMMIFHDNMTKFVSVDQERGMLILAYF